MDSKPDPHLSNPNRGPIKIRLGHQNRIFEAPVEEEMEKVSLIESKMGPNCTVEDVGPVGLLGEVRDDGVCDGIKEAKSIGEETSEDSSSSESSSSSSSPRSSDEDEEPSSISEDDDDDDNEGDEVGEGIDQAEEGEENGDDVEDAISGSDGEGAVPKGPIKSKHEIEVYKWLERGI